MAQEKLFEQNQNSTIKRSKIFEMVTCSLLIALVFVFTFFVQFTLPFASGGGLIHMGNVMVFVAAIVFGPRRGFIAAAFGMALFDVVSGWASYALITFISKGLMAYIAGTLAYTAGKQGKSVLFNSLGIILGGLVMIAGYYIGEIFMLGSFVAPLANIPGNITQIVIGFVLGLPLASILKRYKYFSNMYGA
ncbi:ECF transporter S component [Clostridium cylindrosporum]|uniref:ECF transporter S component n=1 Tax=Clostridium cylindrosporum DSM 605 TaxID=1121307 RepID=A0A0J8DB40_CLOCY|nr:ECF transporter S component [Clostridium cylindrosporum]KMT23295.1 hypothetical protein CLCY_8c00310 [Clostridium cylindrosporum DSM 605]